jgi:hypothetical protein
MYNFGITGYDNNGSEDELGESKTSVRTASTSSYLSFDGDMD